jgi:hypothetical protein
MKLNRTAVINAIKTARGIALQAGDYLLWKITYTDSKWNIHLFIQIVNADGSIGLITHSETKE